MMGEHDGRVALVTGGSQGIGRGAAMELAAEGAAVVVHGYTLDLAEEAVAQIQGAGGVACAVSGPIDDPETSQGAVEQALRRFGRLDTLVTSAGIQRYGDVEETTEALWDEVFDVNVKGVFLAAHYAIPELRKSPSGSIVV